MIDGLLCLAFIGPGGPEILVVMLVLLMMFGAKDAPRILRKLNEIINQIRNTADGFKREVMYGDLNNKNPTNESPDKTDDPDDYDYDSEEDDYDYSEDEGDTGEAFKEMEAQLVEEQPTSDEPEVKPILPEEENGDVQKT